MITFDGYLDQASAILENTARFLARDLRESGISKILDGARGRASDVLAQIDVRAREAERSKAKLPDNLEKRREQLRTVVAEIRAVNTLEDAQSLVDSIKSWNTK